MSISYQRNKKRTDDIHSNNIESRVASVETAMEHIEIGFSDLKGSITSHFLDLNSRIDRQSANSKPNIVAWAGWAAVLLLVIGMFGSGYIRDLNRVETSQNYSLEQQQQHDVSLSGMQQQIIALAKEQDAYLGLGEVISDLQARMLNEEKENLAHPGLNITIAKHEEQLRAMNINDIEHLKVDLIVARQEEKIRALEREIWSNKVLVSPDTHTRP